MESKIRNITRKFNFRGQSGAVLYWKCTPVGNGWVLTVADQPFISTQDQQGLENYRRRCLGFGHVRPDTWGQQDCFAGLAAETRFPHYRTEKDINQFLGQLVIPVFRYHDSRGILVGVIEFVTYLPEDICLPRVNQINNLLMDENLTTSKKIKVEYMNNTIMFALPLWSGISYLWEKVTERFRKLNPRAFQIKYLDYKGISLPILSDGDLQACIADPISMGTMTIRMLIE